MNDNIIFADFRRDPLDKFVAEQLDKFEITDADLRQPVLDLAEKWADKVMRGCSVRASNITVNMDAVSPGVREAIRLDVQRWMAESIASWYADTGKEMLIEIVKLGIGQAKLEQRARQRGFSLVD